MTNFNLKSEVCHTKRDGHLLFKILNLKFNRRGFTLVELTLVIAIFIILFGTGAVALGNFVSGQGLHTAENYLSQSLHDARSFSVAQHHDSEWGVYLDTVTDPDRLILFKGSSYPLRDEGFDQTTPFHKSVSFKQISLASGLSEIVFAKRTGQTGDYGTVTLGTDNENVQISLNALGIIYE